MVGIVDDSGQRFFLHNWSCSAAEIVVGVADILADVVGSLKSIDLVLVVVVAVFSLGSLQRCAPADYKNSILCFGCSCHQCMLHCLNRFISE